MYVTGGALEPALDQLQDLVSAIGEKGFGKSLLDCWHVICRADYCTVYHIDREGARSITTASVVDGETGPRQVGAVSSTAGSGIPWWRPRASNWSRSRAPFSTPQWRTFRSMIFATYSTIGQTSATRGPCVQSFRREA